MSTFFGHNPFPSGSSSPICDNITPINSPAVLICPQDSGCLPCSISENDTKFLNCYIYNFTSKLGLGPADSSITLELIEPHQIDSCVNEYCVEASSEPGICVSTDRREFVPSSSREDCLGQGNTVWLCGVDPNINPSDTIEAVSYNGRIGYVYTVQLGKFYFRGILSNHQYRESDGGYRYSVTLNDGRQALDNVKVILNGFYDDVPDSIKPNIINALYELEPSVTDDNCGSGYKCRDFVNSENSTRGMLFKKALQAINCKYIQLPVSKACLIIDVSRIINICSDYIRTSSSDMSVLEIISAACDESGYTFYIRIEGNSIVAYPVSQKAPISQQDLFNFMNGFDTETIVDRNYGEELTYEKSKKFIVGENYKYLLEIDTSASFAPIVPVASGSCDGILSPEDTKHISQFGIYTNNLAIEDITQDIAILAPTAPTCTPGPGL